MKMDVSYTDHSHIIGKGGNTIRRVMAETNCHIHFPDSNRSNPNEKSNQVSIAGEMGGVERARARVRELTPLLFQFDLAIVPSFQVHLKKLRYRTVVYHNRVNDFLDRRKKNSV
jgi:protein bicaudal C